MFNNVKFDWQELQFAITESAGVLYSDFEECGFDADGDFISTTSVDEIVSEYYGTEIVEEFCYMFNVPYPKSENEMSKYFAELTNGIKKHVEIPVETERGVFDLYVDFYEGGGIHLQMSYEILNNGTIHTTRLGALK